MKKSFSVVLNSCLILAILAAAIFVGSTFSTSVEAAQAESKTANYDIGKQNIIIDETADQITDEDISKMEADIPYFDLAFKNCDEIRFNKVDMNAKDFQGTMGKANINMMHHCKVIVADNFGFDFTEAVLAHELGHVLDYSYNLANRDDVNTWIQDYEEMAQDIGEDYSENYVCPQEAVANAFALYAIDDDFAEKYPEANEWVENILAHCYAVEADKTAA